MEKYRGGKISRMEIIAVEIISFSVLSKLFILFLINFVIITTFFSTYNYNKKVVVTTYNYNLQRWRTLHFSPVTPPFKKNEFKKHKPQNFSLLNQKLEAFKNSTFWPCSLNDTGSKIFTLVLY